MKIVVNNNQKIGQPNYGSFGAGCSFEMEIDQGLLTSDPQSVLANCRLLGDLARAAVERELDLQRKGKPREADPALAADGFDTDDGPESRRPARGRDNSDRDPRTEEQRRESREERQRGYDNYVRENQPRDDRPVQYQDGGRQPERRGGNSQQDNRWKGGLPKSGSQLYKWFCSQSDDLKRRVVEWQREQDMPEQYRDWPDEAVADCLRAVRADGRRANGYAGSRNGNGNGNGRSY